MPSPFDPIVDRRPEGGVAALNLVRQDRHVAVCFTCRKFHPLRDNNADQDYADFAFRHSVDRGHVVLRMTPDYLKRACGREQRRRRRLGLSTREFTHNASVLEAFQGSDQSLDLTSLNSLANSATAGWGSQMIDNSSNLYPDYMAALKLAAVNTAPGSDKNFYVFTATSLNTSDLPTTGASSGNVVTSSTSTAAALTFPSISTLPQVLPLVYTQPYPVQNIANQTPLFTVARAFGGSNVGLYLWLALVNFSGMTIAASGNSFKYRGVYSTVA